MILYWPGKNGWVYRFLSSTEIQSFHADCILSFGKFERFVGSAGDAVWLSNRTLRANLTIVSLFKRHLSGPTGLLKLTAIILP